MYRNIHVHVLVYVIATRRSGPTVWCKERSTEWRRGIEERMYGEEWWRENLRMSLDTFLTVCNHLRPHIERQVTNFREPISVEVRVAVTVWRLPTNTEYCTISALFGLGLSTVGEIVLGSSIILMLVLCVFVSVCL